MTTIAPPCPHCGWHHQTLARVRAPRFTLAPHAYETPYAPGIYPSREAAEDAACAARQEDEA